MVRFSAPEEDIAALLRFATRSLNRSGKVAGKRSRVVMTPLAASSREEFRFRKTHRPLLRHLRQCSEATAWGLRWSGDDYPGVVASRNGDGNLHVDPDASRLVVLLLGPAHGSERRREAVLEARDWTGADMAGLTPDEAAAAIRDTEDARRLVERCTRRIRRHGHRRDGRWHL